MNYITLAGDALDLICYQHYGRESGTTELVLAQNPDLANQPVFLPAGITIALPDIEQAEPVTNAVNLWD